MKSHTPGPYRAEGGAIKAISHGRWFTVARVDRGKFTPEGRENNARLLAAAPEMLEALRGCLMYLDVETFGPDENQPWDGNIRSVICAAIAKAENGG